MVGTRVFHVPVHKIEAAHVPADLSQPITKVTGGLLQDSPRTGAMLELITWTQDYVNTYKHKHKSVRARCAISLQLRKSNRIPKQIILKKPNAHLGYNSIAYQKKEDQPPHPTNQPFTTRLMYCRKAWWQPSRLHGCPTHRQCSDQKYGSATLCKMGRACAHEIT